ncbi:MAG: ORC1-type DNA replication protein [Candidatus Bathyarchaeota archaeon]|nr:ORC1-type DNA replication protein [Candidatus Bathyarchaeota archaeon]
MQNNKDQIDDIFDKFLQGPKIFTDREVLRPDYVPDNLPHREDQIQQIAKILAPVLDEARGSNIFIYGKTGTGKTAVVKYVLNRLIRRSNEIGALVENSYVNCRLVGTVYRVLLKLGESIDLKIPFTGLATSEVFDRFEDALDLKGVLLIVVLDEIDALIKVYGDNLIYELTRVNETLNKGKVSLICISNDLLFKDLLDPRVLSSLGEEEVVFRPYTAPELKDILLERAKISFNDDVLMAGSLNLCSALAAAEHGDARRALDLLRVAGELTEREGVAKVTEEHVRCAQKKIEEDRVVLVLKTLPIHSKLVLCSIYIMSRAKVKNAITGDVYEVYIELCNQLGLESLTQRRISGLINELDITGILNARVVSLGRYGRTKKIRLAISNVVIKDVFSNDPWTKKIIDYSPKCMLNK